jgi:hypothetical protein
MRVVAKPVIPASMVPSEELETGRAMILGTGGSGDEVPDDG